MTIVTVKTVTDKNGKYIFTMPASKVTVEAAFAVENSFVDVSSDAYYYDAVLWAAEKGITDGTSDTTFSPDMECSRAHMATFLCRMAGGKAESDTIAFNDVKADAYYAESVQWAVKNGITKGTGNNKFSPDTTCTRGQMVTFLYRYYVK